MHYFKTDTYDIKKYDVTFDKEKIRKLRKNIIDNCSIITHKEFESEIITKYDSEFMLNFKEKFVGYKEYFEKSEPIYHYSYDLVTPPNLVYLIDRLLIEDVSAINEILDYNYNNETTIDFKINRAKNELNNIDELDTKAKIKKLEELETLLKLKKTNSNQRSTEDYYKKLIKLINFKLLNSLHFIKFNELKQFLDADLNITNGEIVIQKKKTKK